MTVSYVVTQIKSELYACIILTYMDSMFVIVSYILAQMLFLNIKSTFNMDCSMISN